MSAALTLAGLADAPAYQGCHHETYDGAGECGQPLSQYADKNHELCQEHLTQACDDEDADYNNTDTNWGSW